MKQVIQSYRNGKIILGEVPEPACKPGGVVVRTGASLISAGTEKWMIEMGRKSLLGKARARPDLVQQAWAKAQKEGFISVFKEVMNRLDAPLPLGYSAAGVVVEVGPGVTRLKPGDRVAAAGAGFATHAEMLWVPESLCLPLPEELDFEAGAFVMLGGIALHGVRQAALTLGESCAVIGLGLLGLLSVQLLAAQGCRVVGIDLDRHKGALARELGAELALVVGEDHIEEAIANVTSGQGADAVLITAATEDNRPLKLAEAVARERARLVLVGVADISLTRQAFWDKELSFTVSRASGPGSLEPLREGPGGDYPPSLVRWTERRNLEAFLQLVARGRVRVDRLITHRFPISEALQAYDLILENREPYIGVLLTYPQGPGTTRVRKVYLGEPRPGKAPAPRLAVGLIGGGMFAKNILLPALKKVSGVHLKGVATSTGITAHHLAGKYGFAYAATDYREILQDPAIGSVIIATRHHLHGPMVLEALEAGKHIMVEKPLCLTPGELEQIVAAYDGSRRLMVGFNRRFSSLTQKLKDFLAPRSTPLVMTYRVNAGFIPADHWVHDPRVGGGRLLGEVCHFIDLLQYLADARPVQVSAQSISGATGKYRPDDNLSLTLTFEDGSVGHILYTAKGSKAFSRERLEIFGEDQVALMEDFRRARLVRGSRAQGIKKLSMDLGYQGELQFFFSPTGSDQELFDSYVSSTLATFKAAQALKTGETQRIWPPADQP